MPEEISAYTMTTIGDQEAIIRTYSRHSRKAIKRWLLVNDRVIEDQVIPCDEYPIVPFTFSVANRPDRVYGIMHYIKDISKALNKFWSLMIYDMQTSTFRKVFYPKGALVDPAKAEKDWARPMAFIEYNVNPDIPDGGRPFITEPGALSPAIEKVLGMLQNLLEYITGISSLMQGQATSATPDTFGGIQTMQTFGTQRVKLYSRWLEHSIERISYVLVSYLQAYAPNAPTPRSTLRPRDGQSHKGAVLRVAPPGSRGHGPTHPPVIKLLMNAMGAFSSVRATQP
jgi:hypothetical protein